MQNSFHWYSYGGYGSTPLYTPTFYQILTGFDYGTDRSFRNSLEAYNAFIIFMMNTRDNVGWSDIVVQNLIERAKQYKGNLNTPAIDFWNNVQKNIIAWVHETGYEITDLPKWESTFNVLDNYTDGAFSYNKLKLENDQFLQNLAKQTTKDIWSYWNELPKEIRWAIYGIGGIIVLSYTLPIIKGVSNLTKLIITKKDKGD